RHDCWRFTSRRPGDRRLPGMTSPSVALDVAVVPAPVPDVLLAEQDDPVLVVDGLREVIVFRSQLSDPLRCDAEHFRRLPLPCEVVDVHHYQSPCRFSLVRWLPRWSATVPRLFRPRTARR